jgi:hypothetical protein
LDEVSGTHSAGTGDKNAIVESVQESVPEGMAAMLRAVLQAGAVHLRFIECAIELGTLPDVALCNTYLSR